MLSNVDDLCRWMLVHLNEGRYGENLEKQLFTLNQSARNVADSHPHSGKARGTDTIHIFRDMDWDGDYPT